MLGLGGTACAIAADLPPVIAKKAAPPDRPSWTGFYAGAGGGGAVGLFSFFHPATGIDTGSTLHGGLAGGDLGYNRQVGAWVYGFETDLSWADISGSAPCVNPVFTCAAKVDWFGTARARIGWAADRFLPYVTGGFAYGNEQRDSFGLGTALTQNQIHTGWTLGTGIDYALSPNWSMRAEYLYVDLSGAGYAGARVPGNGVTVVYGHPDLDARFHVVRATLNYRFDWSAPFIAQR
jgi:outer membrane immunogenic protein